MDAFGLILVAICIALVIVTGWLALSRRRIQREVLALRGDTQDRTDHVAAISHEMRTPLALIVGPVELLLEQKPGPLTESQRNFLLTIRRNSERLQAFTEDILDQSRIEAGLFPMHEEVVDLRQLGLLVVDELRFLHKLDIAYDCPGAPPIVRGDPRLLQQAITNLLSNACRYSGSAVVILRIQRQTTTTLVSIDDRGLGMTRDQRRVAFERFGTTGYSSGGVGLGMGITREIVRLHGGTLHVQSTPNTGTLVAFTVPNAEN